MTSFLGRYRIESEIGRGSMGVVYRAFDTQLERSIALKQLIPVHGEDPAHAEEMVERFQREARAAARLAHPNVVQVYDFGVEDCRYFIAMELLEGVSLSELIDRGGVTTQVAVELLCQILDAVQAAHELGIVHRDLKPDNIFVLPDGRVKVADFGIAKLKDSAGSRTMTQIGIVIGTPGYMAPEQVLGLPVDERADIFSIGVIGYELLGGSNPFAGASTTNTLYRIAHESPQPLSAAGLDDYLSLVIAKAMDKQPECRYQSAAGMARDIRDGAAPSSMPHSPAAALGPPVTSGTGRNSWAIGLTVAVGVVLVAILALSTGGAGSGGAGGSSVRTAATPAEDAPAVEMVEVPAPSVTGERVAGNEVEVRLDSDVAFASVRYLVNGTPVGEPLTAPPYAWTWMVPAAGDYELSAVAVDNEGIERQGTAYLVNFVEPAVGSGAAIEWDTGTSTAFWTAIYANHKTRAEAEAKARDGEAAGFPSTVLLSDEWDNLDPGWWVACSGEFLSEDEARQRARELKDAGFDAYQRYTGELMVGD